MLKGTIMLFKVLCALRMKENIHKPVFEIARFQWSHAAKMTCKLLLVTIIAKSLETFVFIITCYCKATISAYLSPLTDYLAFHSVSQRF